MKHIRVFENFVTNEARVRGMVPRDSTSISNEGDIEEVRSLAYDLTDEMFDVQIQDVTMTKDDKSIIRFQIKIESPYSISLSSGRRGYAVDSHTGRYEYFGEESDEKENGINLSKLSKSLEENKKMIDLSLEFIRRLEATNDWIVTSFFPEYTNGRPGRSGLTIPVIKIFCIKK